MLTGDAAPPAPSSSSFGLLLLDRQPGAVAHLRPAGAAVGRADLPAARLLLRGAAAGAQALPRPRRWASSSSPRRRQLLMPRLRGRPARRDRPAAASCCIDVASYVFAIADAGRGPLPATARLAAPGAAAGGDRRRAALLAGGTAGFRPMLLFFAVLNIFLSPRPVLISPLVLSFATSTQVGPGRPGRALGAVVGGVLMSLWGGPRHRRHARRAARHPGPRRRAACSSGCAPP